MPPYIYFAPVFGAFIARRRVSSISERTRTYLSVVLMSL
jgi:hypothetical protein